MQRWKLFPESKRLLSTQCRVIVLLVTLCTNSSPAELPKSNTLNISGFSQKYSKIIFKKKYRKAIPKKRAGAKSLDVFYGLFTHSTVCGPAVSASSGSPLERQNLRSCHGQWPKERFIPRIIQNSILTISWAWNGWAETVPILLFQSLISVFLCIILFTPNYGSSF